MNLRPELQHGAGELGVDIALSAQDKLLNYVEMLHKWNKTYNLTAIRDPRQMISHHLLDSIAITPYLWPGKWLDVGCGAGLPGIVIAILNPQWDIVLLDSNSKKTSFVQQVMIELELKNIEVQCARIENYQPADPFEGIISRAFTELGSFMTLTQHLLAKSGKWAAMKGYAEKELDKIPPDCEVERIIELNIPGLSAARSLVIAARKEQYLA